MELRVLRALERPLYGASLEVCLKRSEFEIELPPDLLKEFALSIERIVEAFERFRRAEAVPFQRPAKRSRAAGCGFEEGRVGIGRSVQKDHPGSGFAWWFHTISITMPIH